MSSSNLEDYEKQREEIMERLIDREAFLISVRPYLESECSYTFDFPGEGKVVVEDENYDRPQKLANWIFKLTDISEVNFEPEDTIQLTLEVQRRLTTEQGDFTTLMMLHKLFPDTPKAVSSDTDLTAKSPQMKPAGKKND